MNDITLCGTPGCPLFIQDAPDPRGKQLESQLVEMGAIRAKLKHHICKLRGRSDQLADAARKIKIDMNATYWPDADEFKAALAEYDAPEPPADKADTACEERARLNAIVASLLAENAKLKAALEAARPGNTENGELR